jgi:hypothetical protein
LLAVPAERKEGEAAGLEPARDGGLEDAEAREPGDGGRGLACDHQAGNCDQARSLRQCQESGERFGEGGGHIYIY